MAWRWWGKPEPVAGSQGPVGVGQLVARAAGGQGWVNEVWIGWTRS